MAISASANGGAVGMPAHGVIGGENRGFNGNIILAEKYQ